MKSIYHSKLGNSSFFSKFESKFVMNAVLSFITEKILPFWLVCVPFLSRLSWFREPDITWLYLSCNGNKVVDYLGLPSLLHFISLLHLFNELICFVQNILKEMLFHLCAIPFTLVYKGAPLKTTFKGVGWGKWRLPGEWHLSWGLEWWAGVS